MMENYDQSVEMNHNQNCPYIPDYPHRILIISGSGSDKINVVLNLIKHQQPVIDKIYLYVKDSFQSKHQLLINGREKVWIKKLNNPKAFINYLQTADGVYKNLEEFNPTKKWRALIVFDDMIADKESYKKVSPIVTELFLRYTKVNISLVFISQS